MKIKHAQKLKPRSKRSKKQMGWTLIEYLVTFAAVAGLAAYAFAKMGDNTETRKIETAKTVLADGAEKIRTRYRSWGNYSNVTNTSCYQGKIFPSDWLSATADQFTTPFSDNGLTCGSVNTATDLDGNTSSGTGKYFTFTLSNLTRSQCDYLVNELVRQFTEVQIGTDRVDSNLVVESKCVDGVSVTFIGR
ncbi:hypothetical protein BOO92_18320 [Vibrio navarrensis]|uniref:hypothetical protein n=1 Tax=Vibrio TaxID=662 RepID=UPI0018680FDC|nr:hypothetical protein [Vibrio navarrensis]HAS6100836.1 hypothetical protein [Vibrio vulnificus]EHA1126475.1 hypothetical protein [Vibrio navarrensis]MBE3658629.1 hypothetical protein [Vibrio navarrensis]MBH9740041.1 hypothetical protein [Vibrio navarrensis]HDY8121384.1 hypothetical protein [Vibrio vulnificus]